MRYRLMASYYGAPYQAGVGPSASEVTLFAACPPPEEHGFSSASGHWRKQVRINEIDALWESRPVGSYHGEPCLVLDDLGDRLHIAYLGMDESRASQLGYWQVDRGVFEVVIPRLEVADLAEERHEFPVTALMAALTPLGLRAAEPPALTAPRAVAGPRAVASPEPLPVVPPPAAAWHGSPEEDGGWYANPRGIPAVNGSGPVNGHGTGPLPLSRTGPFPSLHGSAPSNGSAPLNWSAPTADLESTRIEPPIPVEVFEPTRATLAEQAVPAPVFPAPHEPVTLPDPAPPVSAPLGSAPLGSAQSASAQPVSVVRGRRAARKPRVATQSVFAELLDQARIPRTSYAVDEEVSGAMCVVKTGGGFEVFSCANDARHEVRFFEDEEAAYFYLFGVLAAEALRNGHLAPQ